MSNRVSFTEGIYSVCCGSGHVGTKHNFSGLPNKVGMNQVLSLSKKQSLERMLLHTFAQFAEAKSTLCDVVIVCNVINFCQ